MHIDLNMASWALIGLMATMIVHQVRLAWSTSAVLICFTTLLFLILPDLDIKLSMFNMCQLIAVMNGPMPHPITILIYGFGIGLTHLAAPDWVPALLLASVFLFLPQLIHSWLKKNRHISVLMPFALLLIMGTVLLIGSSTHTTYLLLVLALIVLQIFNPRLYPISQTVINNDTENMWAELLDYSRQQERQRIYRNIHDEAGAALLQLIYQLDGHEAQPQAKNIMQKIRVAVADTAQFSINFEELFEDICAETDLRLRSAGIEFSHRSDIKEATTLDPNMPESLARMTREIVSNIIKHADATHVQFFAKWTTDKKSLTICDDGIGMHAASLNGKGMQSIQQRSVKINAHVIWSKPQDGGTKVKVTW